MPPFCVDQDLQAEEEVYFIVYDGSHLAPADAINEKIANHTATMKATCLKDGVGVRC